MSKYGYVYRYYLPNLQSKTLLNTNKYAVPVPTALKSRDLVRIYSNKDVKFRLKRVKSQEKPVKKEVSQIKREYNAWQNGKINNSIEQDHSFVKEAINIYSGEVLQMQSRIERNDSTTLDEQKQQKSLSRFQHLRKIKQRMQEDSFDEQEIPTLKEFRLRRQNLFLNYSQLSQHHFLNYAKKYILHSLQNNTLNKKHCHLHVDPVFQCFSIGTLFDWYVLGCKKEEEGHLQVKKELVIFRNLRDCLKIVSKKWFSAIEKMIEQTFPTRNSIYHLFFYEDARLQTAEAEFDASHLQQQQQIWPFIIAKHFTNFYNNLERTIEDYLHAFTGAPVITIPLKHLQKVIQMISQWSNSCHLLFLQNQKKQRLQVLDINQIFLKSGKSQFILMTQQFYSKERKWISFQKLEQQYEQLVIVLYKQGFIPQLLAFQPQDLFSHFGFEWTNNGSLFIVLHNVQQTNAKNSISLYKQRNFDFFVKIGASSLKKHTTLEVKLSPGQFKLILQLQSKVKIFFYSEMSLNLIAQGCSNELGPDFQKGSAWKGAQNLSRISKEGIIKGQKSKISFIKKGV